MCPCSFYQFIARHIRHSFVADSQLSTYLSLVGPKVVNVLTLPLYPRLRTRGTYSCSSGLLLRHKMNAVARMKLNVFGLALLDCLSIEHQRLLTLPSKLNVLGCTNCRTLGDFDSSA